MISQFKKGIIELCILKMIERKDMYGFELIQEVDKHVNINENTVYPILRRLTNEGFFDTYVLKSVVGPDRKYYHLNESGKLRCTNLMLEWEAFLEGTNKILKGAY